ncbi:MAG: hypothetical protein JWR69_2572, partial [Pedosphaera sp.]|nr:hypothetical protein [Pedosphaera sp.]
AFPAADGATISNNTYTMVVRADGATTAVEYNIADSNAANDDAVTGLSNGNGLSNGVPVFAQARLVSPDSTLDLQYPSQPREYRFNFVAVPNSGTATITVRLKKLTTTVYTNRFTTRTRTVNTAAPTQIVHISAPATDGQVLRLKPNDLYTIQTCFSTNLYTNDITLFSIYINGVFQPRLATNGSPLYFIQSPTCGSGFMTLGYRWTNASPGSNIIQVTVTKNPAVMDTRTVTVVNPIFNITSFTPGLSGGSIVWDSVPSVNYQVWATTNLLIPMVPISTVIPGSGSSTFYFDPAPDTTNKFYRIQLLP